MTTLSCLQYLRSDTTISDCGPAEYWVPDSGVAERSIQLRIIRLLPSLAEIMLLVNSIQNYFKKGGRLKISLKVSEGKLKRKQKTPTAAWQSICVIPQVFPGLLVVCCFYCDFAQQIKYGLSYLIFFESKATNEKNQRFISFFAADSAFTMLRKSHLVNDSFIVSNPLQKEPNDTSLNLVKIGFPPCGSEKSLSKSTWRKTNF